MKAAVFKALGKPLEIEDRPDPVPGQGEVILKVHRCGICGTDLHMTEPGGRIAACESVLGHEMAGEVVALGKGVSRLRVGDRVAALPLKGCGTCTFCKAGEPSWCVNGLDFLAGGYAQYARAGAEECLVLSKQLSFADGALVEPLAVALHGLRMAGDLSGATVTIIGCGPIGLATVFWAKRLGARLIRVVEGNQFRASMARDIGADEVFAPGAPGEAAPNPDPSDCVVECVGKPGLLLAALEHVRPRGTLISLGFCMAPEQFLAAAAGAREITMKFPILYTLDDYRTVIAALDSGAVEPRAMVTGSVGCAAFPEAFESLRRPDQQCKVMFEPWEA